VPGCRNVLLPETTGAPAKLCLLITTQMFEVQLDQPRIVEIGCKVVGSPRCIYAHAGDGTPNLGRQTLDTLRIPGIVAPYLTAASECGWLIGKQEQQNSGRDWRTSYVTHPHASTPSQWKIWQLHSRSKDYQECQRAPVVVNYPDSMCGAI
jgi:hypothetical protein